MYNVARGLKLMKIQEKEANTETPTPHRNAIFFRGEDVLTIRVSPTIKKM